MEKGKKKVFGINLVILLSLPLMAMAAMKYVRMISAPAEVTYWIAATDTPLPTATPWSPPPAPPGYCYCNPQEPPPSGCTLCTPEPSRPPTATPQPTPTPFIARYNYYLNQPISIADGAFIRLDRLELKKYKGKNLALFYYTIWNTSREPLMNAYFNLWHVPKVNVNGKSSINTISPGSSEIVEDFLFHTSENYGIQKFGAFRYLTIIPNNRRPYHFVGADEISSSIPIPENAGVSPSEIVPYVLLYTDAASFDYQTDPIVIYTTESPYKCPPDSPQADDKNVCLYHAEINVPEYTQKFYHIPFPKTGEDLLSGEESNEYWLRGGPGDGSGYSTVPNENIPVPYTLNGMLSPVIAKDPVITQGWGPSSCHDDNGCCWYLHYYPPEQCRCNDGTLSKTCPKSERLVCTYCKNVGGPMGAVGCAHHTGIDIGNVAGANDPIGNAKVVAVFDGVVSYVNKGDTSYGLYVCVASNDVYPPYGVPIEACYAHLSAIALGPNGNELRRGDEIKKGQVLGVVGGTGFHLDKMWATHLHFEIRKLNPDGTRPQAGTPNDTDPFFFLSNPYFSPVADNMQDLLKQQEELKRVQAQLEDKASQCTDKACAAYIAYRQNYITNMLETIRIKLQSTNMDDKLVMDNGEMKPTISLVGGAYRHNNPQLQVSP